MVAPHSREHPECLQRADGTGGGRGLGAQGGAQGGARGRTGGVRLRLQGAPRQARVRKQRPFHCPSSQTFATCSERVRGPGGTQGSASAQGSVLLERPPTSAPAWGPDAPREPQQQRAPALLLASPPYLLTASKSYCVSPRQPNSNPYAPPPPRLGGTGREARGRISITAPPSHQGQRPPFPHLPAAGAQFKQPALFCPELTSR